MTVSTTSYAPPGSPPEYFRSVVFLNTIQSTFSCIAAFLYLYTSKSSSLNLWEMVGLPRHGFSLSNKTTYTTDGRPQTYWYQRYPFSLLVEIVKVSILQSIAPLFGFASLRFISFPTMILGKSCKLVPVMLMNILLYRRKFAVHKYAVVAIVTAGITLFMLLGDEHGTGDGGKKRKGAESSSLLGISLLIINLILDGSVNSTQDEIFKKFSNINGTQMMFWMNAFATIVTSLSLFIPFPSIPILSSPGASNSNQFRTALEFIHNHPHVLSDLLLFSLFGALGQIFIFLTLANFGSLVLVTITVTRKLFTMLLSVFVYGHALNLGQWLGVACVFAGIGIEAFVQGGKKNKKGETRADRVVHDKEKAKLKDV
ncbi:UAA transporter [Atractiella rhizophila]|nr:UAA transporter [Atractiella rhizophila]KAH8925008.1 UAA transporter [Atractiella rhizophila]